MAPMFDVLTVRLRDRDEPVVGSRPAPARRHQAWWANSYTAQPHAKAWRDAGRRAQPDFNAARVRFTLGSASTSPPRSSPLATTTRTAAELTPMDESTSLALTLAWIAAGAVRLAGGKPVFPGLPSAPGIYRFTITTPDAEGTAIYIGEPSDLARRMTTYRNAGPTQSTNIRMRALMVESLESGGSVTIDVATAVTVGDEEIDLANRPARLLAENAALLALDAEDVESLNR